MIGKIYMVQLMLDVTDIENVKFGDEVIVFGGKKIPMEQVAEWAGTICYEVVYGISPRVPRHYVHSST